MTFIIVMASSSDISINPSQANAIAKGKRRVKGKTLDLNTFLGEDQDAPSGFAVVNTRRIDWGDAMENEELDDKYTLDFKKEEKLVLPTAPKAARGPDIDINKIPSRPPFTAFLGNLPYDVTEDDIVNFFHQLEVTNVRLPREGGDKGRLRGFGYAEFHDRHSLIQALSLNNETLKNRSIKVSLAGEHDTDRKDDRNDRTTGDWRAATRDQPYFRDDRQRNDGSQYARGYPDRGRASNERELNYGRDRYDKNEKSYERFDRNDQGYGSDKDWDRAYNADREQRYNRRNSNRNFEFADRGLDRGGRNNRRDFGGNFKDNYERRRDDYVRERDSRYRESRERDYPYRDSCDSGGYESREERESSEKDYPKERRKLQLKPRTKPLETSNVPFEPLSNSAIFGGARPVDTAAREREIEERLVKEREESGLRDQKERQDDPKARRFSTSSGISTRSRRSSESGPPTSYRDSFSEDDSIPQGKPPAPRQHFPENRHYNTLPRVRQRRSSASSTGSDRENQTNSRNSRPPTGRRKDDNPDYNYNRKNNISQERLQHQSNNEYRCTDQLTESNRNSRNGHFHHDSSRERPFRISTYEEPKPPVYTSANKFSHLMNDAEELDRGSASD